MLLDKKAFKPYLTEKSFATSFKFHSDLFFKSNKTNFLPFFYWEIIFELGKTSCYDGCNTFLHTESISVI